MLQRRCGKERRHIYYFKTQVRSLYPDKCYFVIVTIIVEFVRPTEHAVEDILPACQMSLKDLQLDCLDLYLMHWPVFLRKGFTPGNLTDDDKLGYDPDKVANVWSVNT